jgi:hypothetical protein
VTDSIEHTSGEHQEALEWELYSRPPPGRLPPRYALWLVAVQTGRRLMESGDRRICSFLGERLVKESEATG